MKNIMIILFILIFEFSVYSQISRDKNSITFSVSNVEKASTNLAEVDYKEAIQTRLNYEIESYPLEFKNQKLIPTDANAFICALHIAFAQHRPLVISPDMIWLLIVQGISIHIQENSDKLQNEIVNFENTKHITIQRNDFIKGDERNNWSNVFPEFTDSIKNYLKDSLYNIFIPNFSTTSSIEKNAFEISLMSAVDKYFEFYEQTFCGIPEITLEGKTSDWELIAKNVENLKISGLEEWFINLKPILNEFVKASKGEIDTLFWKSIYKWNDDCGSIISGWIIKFFPYVGNSNNFKMNYFISGDNFAYYGLAPDIIPSGLAKAEVIWEILEINKFTEYKMEFYSGFVGIMQDTITKALKPEISWMIRDANSPKIKKSFSKVNYNSEQINDTTFVESYEGIYDYSNNSTLLDTLLISSNEIDIKFYSSTIWDLDNSNKPINEKNKYQKPNIFPEKYDNYEDSQLYLKKYVTKNLSKKRIKFEGKISFVITWFGTIDKVEIIESNNTENNEEIISIIDSIKGCKPGIFQNQITNTVISMDLQIR